MQRIPVFSIRDIEFFFPDFDSRRLVEWQKKDYIIKLRNGYYCFSEYPKAESWLHFAANRIYQPSYVSLQSALSYYGLIPEGVFQVTSITTRNTMQYKTPLAEFTYKSIKPTLYFGYQIIRLSGNSIRIAEPEKALLDFLYLHPLNTESALESLRINRFQFSSTISVHTLNAYLRIFKSKALNQRIQYVINMNHADIKGN
jgi:predicted transcriptional regulator of viral defense system